MKCGTTCAADPGPAKRFSEWTPVSDAQYSIKEVCQDSHQGDEEHRWCTVVNGFRGPPLTCDSGSASGKPTPSRVRRLSFIPLGEPWRNGYVESFNSRARDECVEDLVEGEPVGDELRRVPDPQPLQQGRVDQVSTRPVVMVTYGSRGPLGAASPASSAPPRWPPSHPRPSP